MKLILTSALVAIVGVALCSPVTAATTTPATAPAEKSAKAPKTKSDKTEFKGSIVAIDATSVTVQNTKDKQVIAIAPTTVITKDKKPATLTDFAVGDKVTGSFTKDAAGTLTAATLRTKTAGVAKATKAPAAAPTPATAPKTTAAPAAQ